MHFVCLSTTLLKEEEIMQRTLEQYQVHAGKEDHTWHRWTTSRRGQDSPWKSQSEWQRTEINGESTSMVWPILRSRMAEEQNRTGRDLVNEGPSVLWHWWSGVRTTFFEWGKEQMQYVLGLYRTTVKKVWSLDSCSSWREGYPHRHAVCSCDTPRPKCPWKGLYCITN